VNTFRTLSPISAAEKTTFFPGTISHTILAEMGKISEIWTFSNEGSPKT
jgi:hypothetical protein